MFVDPHRGNIAFSREQEAIWHEASDAFADHSPSDDACSGDDKDKVDH